MSKIPENHNWVKFHHKEWLTKLSTRSCDAATRGIYMDLFALAMTTEETGIIPTSEKNICKQLAIKPSQFNRALKQLIHVKLCVIGKNNQIILTEIVSDFSALVSQQEPIENSTGTQREPNGSSTSKENDRKQPKTKPPIIEKNRIDKKEDNPPLSSLTEKEQMLLNESIDLLVQATELPEQRITLVVNQALEKLGGDISTLRSYIDKAITTAIHPINYLQKLVEEHGKLSNVHPFPKPKQVSQASVRASWSEETGDETFDRLSDEDQAIVRMLQKGEQSDWMKKHYANHNPSAWAYYQKHPNPMSIPQSQPATGGATAWQTA